MKLPVADIMYMAGAMLVLIAWAGSSAAHPVPGTNSCALEVRDMMTLAFVPRGIELTLCRRASPGSNRKGRGILGKLKKLTLGKKSKEKASTSTNLVTSPRTSSSSHNMDWANRPSPSSARSPSWPYSPTHVREPATPPIRTSAPSPPGPMPQPTPPSRPAKSKLMGAWKSVKKFF